MGKRKTKRGGLGTICIGEGARGGGTSRNLSQQGERNLGEKEKSKAESKNKQKEEKRDDKKKQSKTKRF